MRAERQASPVKLTLLLTEGEGQDEASDALVTKQTLATFTLLVFAANPATVWTLDPMSDGEH